MSSSAQSVVRSGKALIVHLLFAALLYGLAYLLMSNYDSASVLVRDQYESDDVMLFLQAAQSKMVGWFLLSLLVSWLAATLFIALCQRKSQVVRGDTEARKSMPLWIILFVVVLGLAAFLWWREVSLAEVAQMLLDNNYLILVTAGFVLTAIAFWVSTGLAVITSLKPAVPGAESLLPNFWN